MKDLLFIFLLVILLVVNVLTEVNFSFHLGLKNIEDEFFFVFGRIFKCFFAFVPLLETKRAQKVFTTILFCFLDFY